MDNYDVFISYRRDGGEAMATLLRDRLTEKGYHVFLDIESLNSGSFNTQLLTVIDSSTDFVLVCSKGCLDRCVNDGDWVRTEIAHALDKKKNIVPVMLRDFVFPENLPGDINTINMQNGINATNHEYFDAAVDRLAEKFLKSKPAFQSAKSFSARQKKSSLYKVLVPICLLLIVGVSAAVFFATRQNNNQTADSWSDDSRDRDDNGEHTLVSDTDTNENPPPETRTQSGEIELRDMVLDGNYYVTLAGSGSLEFTNIFADMVSMPVSVSNARFDYVIFDGDGNVVEYNRNASSYGNSLDAGNRIVISFTDPTTVSDFHFPHSILDVAITVKAYETSALEYVTFTGTGSIVFINISETEINTPKSIENTRRDYAVYDANETVTAYNANSTTRESIAPGARTVISVTDSANTIMFFYPAEWKDTVITVNQIETPALRYETLTGGGSIEFINISQTDINTPKSTDNTRRNYAVYDANGAVTVYNANSTNRESIAPGARNVISVTNSENIITFFYPMEWADTVLSVKQVETPAIHYVTLTGEGSVTFANISNENVAVPKATDNTRRDFVFYDADGNAGSSRTNSTNHGSVLAPDNRLVISLTNSSNSISFYFPTEQLDTVFSVTQ